MGLSFGGYRPGNTCEQLRQCSRMFSRSAKYGQVKYNYSNSHNMAVGDLVSNMTNALKQFLEPQCSEDTFIDCSRNRASIAETDAPVNGHLAM